MDAIRCAASEVNQKRDILSTAVLVNGWEHSCQRYCSGMEYKGLKFRTATGGSENQRLRHPMDQGHVQRCSHAGMLKLLAFFR
eukprot:5408800-Amphidinium_carterae.1